MFKMVLFLLPGYLQTTCQQIYLPNLFHFLSLNDTMMSWDFLFLSNDFDILFLFVLHHVRRPDGGVLR